MMTNDLSLQFQPRNRSVLVLQGLFFVTLFVMSLSFRERAYGNSSVDWQVLLRLGMCAATLGFCFLLRRVWAPQMFQPDNLPIALLLLFFVVSCLWAPSLLYSLGASITVLTFIILPFTCLPILGIRRTLCIVICVLTVSQILSILTYFVYPEIGRAKVWVGAHQVLTSRLAGLTGANGVGASSSLAILLVYFIYASFGGFGRQRMFFFGCFMINLIALVMSNSRTSMVSLALGILVAVFVRRVTFTKLAVLFIGAALLVGAAVLVDYDWLFSELSRSGDPNEISTGTGRTIIWKKALELIAMRPFTGWGYASSSFILPKYSAELGGGAPHCHNLYLQLAFSVGWLGPILYSIVFITKTVQSVSRHDVFRMTLLVSGFISSLTEAGGFVGVATIGTFFFGVVVANNWDAGGLFGGAGLNRQNVGVTVPVEPAASLTA